LKKHNSTAEITLSKITEMCQCDTNAPASRNFKLFTLELKIIDTLQQIFFSLLNLSLFHIL
jgi:hypothetical protein